MGIYRPGEGKGVSGYYQKFELQSGCRKWNWNHPFTFEDPPSNMADFLKQTSAWTPSGRQTPFPLAPVLLALCHLFPFQGCQQVTSTQPSSPLSGTHLLALATCIFLCDISDFCVGQDLTWYAPFLWQKCWFIFLCLPPIEWLIWGRSGKTNRIWKKKVPRHLIALYFILDFTISTSVIREMRIRLHVDMLSSHFGN